MCGICGYVSRQSIRVDELTEMNNTMIHRGPDDAGVEIYPMKDGYSIGLAQRRLSIMDLSALGHQPMHSADHRVSIVYNGEIYNFQEIRQELTDYPFRSSCDTEVIIAAYLKWGIHCVDRFNGMFAFCLYDRQDDSVYLVREVSIGNAVSPYVSQNLGANKPRRIKKGYKAALILDMCFAAIAFIVIETMHTQISSLFLGKDGTALAYQVSGDYMRWLGYFFIFMGIKMATDGVLRGLGIMRPFLIANMVNLAIRLSVALIFAPRFGIAFVWLAVPAGWFANFLISYVALRNSWPTDKVEISQ